MKKILNYAVGMFAVSSLMVSCVLSPDTDTIPDGDLKINYSVQVVPIGNTDKGVQGANVTIQVEGEQRSVTTGADGLAVFENIRPGTVSGHVTANGYTAINFSANISKTNVDVNTIDFVTSTVSLIATNSTIEGRIYGDYNFDGNTTVNDAGNFDVVDVYVSYAIGPNYPMGTGTGALNQVSLDVQNYGVSSGTNGVFMIANLPSSNHGALTSTYWMQDLVKINPSGGNSVFNIGTNAVSLQPGAKRHVGDVFAN